MTANGIDVSNNNGKLNLSGISGLDFVIAKCTEGTGFVDLTYTYYQSHTKTLGKHFGAYHFLHAENLNGEEEAMFFLRHAGLVSGNSVWIDYEVYGTNPDVDSEVVQLFAETVKANSRIKHVGLYANLTGMRRVLPNNVTAAVDPLWLAEYNGQLETPDRPLHPYSWTIHQYEVLSNIDRDYSRLTAAQLTAMFTW